MIFSFLELFCLYIWSFAIFALGKLLYYFSFFTRNKKEALFKRSFTKKDLRKIEKESSLKKKSYCFLASSAGEYEQGLSLISELRKENDVFIILLFFSTSGYLYAKKRGEKLPCYLCPLDTLNVWSKFYAAVGSCKTVVIRHELWPCFLYMAKKNGELYLVNASFSFYKREFFSLYLKRYLYKFFDKIFLVDNSFREEFSHAYNVAKNKIIVSGDTKYERVLWRKEAFFEERKKIKADFYRCFSYKSFNLVAGSVWPEDFHLLVQAVNHLKFIYKLDIRLICVPHELKKSILKEISRECTSYKLSFSYYSQAIKESKNFHKKLNSDVIIIDEIGFLAEVYSLGHCAYVGGGLHSRVHNVLEPSAYGLAISFGPRCHTSYEALKLLKANLAEIVRSSSEIVNWCSYHYDAKFRESKSLLNHMDDQKGATRRVLKYLTID